MPGAADYTALEIEARVIEAVDTLKRLPEKQIRRQVTKCPQFVRASHEAYGYAAAGVRLAPAPPEAITRMDETLDWFRLLPRDAQRIMWSRANGFSWRRIAAFVGKSPNTCRAWYAAGLHHLAESLNRQNLPV